MNGEITRGFLEGSNLLSGLIGSGITALGTWAWSEYKRHREYKSLLNGVVAECDYNLSIIDEILEGVVKAKGSFKRLSVDYFRSIREKATTYPPTFFFPPPVSATGLRSVTPVRMAPIGRPALAGFRDVVMQDARIAPLSVDPSTVLGLS